MAKEIKLKPEYSRVSFPNIGIVITGDTSQEVLQNLLNNHKETVSNYLTILGEDKPKKSK